MYRGAVHCSMVDPDFEWLLELRYLQYTCTCRRYQRRSRSTPEATTIDRHTFNIYMFMYRVSKEASEGVCGVHADIYGPVHYVHVNCVNVHIYKSYNTWALFMDMFDHLWIESTRVHVDVHVPVRTPRRRWHMLCTGRRSTGTTCSEKARLYATDETDTQHVQIVCVCVYRDSGNLPLRVLVDFYIMEKSTL